jgi:hypothetical protein
MVILKSVTLPEQMQFLKEVGFKHGNKVLSFQYALDGEWVKLPRCMRDTLPSRWVVESLDPPPEPVWQAPQRPVETFGPATWRLEENAVPFD